MEKLAALGEDLEPYLRAQLADAAIHNEIAIILSKMGNRDTIPALIDVLPTQESLSLPENDAYTCTVYALWELTGIPLGIDGRMTQGYTPDIQRRWQEWFESRKDYLYDAAREPAGAPRTLDTRVLIDSEARLLGIPSRDYRKEHPWISYDDIRTWAEGAAYEKRLRSYCLSILFKLLVWGGTYDDDVIFCLGDVEDSIALTALRRLAEELGGDDTNLVWVGWALREKGAAAVPDLERIVNSKEGKEVRYAEMALTWVKVEAALGSEISRSRLETDEVLLLDRCLKGKEGVKALLERLAAPKSHAFAKDVEVARFVKDEEVRAALEKIREMPDVSDEVRIRALLGLVQQGKAAARDDLRRQLDHPKPHVRLAAAEALWESGTREGFDVLVSLLNLRPLEDGHPPARVHTIIRPSRESSLFVVRRACEILGDMGDPKAIEPMKRLLSENLNGVLSKGGLTVGTGWYGRPDVVALAKLGDFSGIETLRQSLAAGDPLRAVGTRGWHGDVMAIGLKRLAREILPLLGSEEREKQIYAARAILHLLDKGK